MEKRVEKLEATIPDVQLRLIRIESKFESLESHLATKADLHEIAADFHKSMTEQTWKFLAGSTSMAVLFSALAFGLARHMA